MPSDWDSILDKLEDNRFGAFHLVVGVLGAATATAIGIAHLGHPSVLGRLQHLSRLGAIAVIVIGVAPAFAAVLALGQLVYPTVGGPVPDRSGPMSGYLQQEREGRKWRLRIVAAALGAMNYLFLIFTSI